MAETPRPSTVKQPTDASQPTELNAGQLDSLTGGGEETVIYQYGAIGISYAVDTGSQARGDQSAKGIIQAMGR